MLRRLAKLSARRRIMIATGGASLAALAAAVFAFAGHETGSVVSYSGCLNPNGGTLHNLAEGATPLKPCNPGQPEIHLSGGDITGVGAGAGLTGGGANGAVQLAVDE